MGDVGGDPVGAGGCGHPEAEEQHEGIGRGAVRVIRRREHGLPELGLHQQTRRSQTGACPVEADVSRRDVDLLETVELSTSLEHRDHSGCALGIHTSRVRQLFA